MALEDTLRSILTSQPTRYTPPTPTRKTSRSTRSTSTSTRTPTTLAQSLRLPERDPYEVTEATPGYGAIAGLTEQLNPLRAALSGDAYNLAGDRLDMGENMISQAVISSLIEQDLPLTSLSESGQYWGLATPPPDLGAGAGDGGGGGAPAIPEPTPITWSVGNYKAFGPNIPTWWKPMVPQGTAANERPDVQFSLMMNAMIPYVSPEDQVTVARKLYETWGDQFGIYKQIGIKGTRTQGGVESAGRAPISREQQQRGIEGQLANEQFFRGPQRADFARQTLESVRQNVTKDIGAGGRFMEDILSAISQTGGRRTRASTVEMMGQVDPMLAGAQAGALGPYGPLGKMAVSPFFGRFQQDPVQRTQTGEYVFGKPSKLLQF